jgi:hypothetical protein
VESDAISALDATHYEHIARVLEEEVRTQSRDGASVASLRLDRTEGLAHAVAWS